MPACRWADVENGFADGRIAVCRECNEESCFGDHAYRRASRRPMGSLAIFILKNGPTCAMPQDEAYGNPLLVVEEEHVITA